MKTLNEKLNLLYTGSNGSACYLDRVNCDIKEEKLLSLEIIHVPNMVILCDKKRSFYMNNEVTILNCKMLEGEFFSIKSISEHGSVSLVTILDGDGYVGKRVIIKGTHYYIPSF